MANFFKEYHAEIKAKKIAMEKTTEKILNITEAKSFSSILCMTKTETESDISQTIWETIAFCQQKQKKML